MYFIIFISLFILQRLSELYIARGNEKWLLANGAIEYGQSHYPFIVGMHTLFIVSIICEYFLRGQPPISWVFLVLFILVLSFKFWALSSLGKYWNTKIFRIPGVYPVKKGPYKFFKASELYGGSLRDSHYSPGISFVLHHDYFYCFKCHYANGKNKNRE